MKKAYFWPIYGEQDEIAITWSTGRGMLYVQQQLTDFTGSSGL
ncbi:IS66 family transposase [Motilimonas cestriensis]|uniref:IS66 family transposase n=1 Tax=Motilimonas cestriensis TaxID=2742685 RepID=A0ABS8WEH4_9GAMM|nr:IS66 family transposase [Motilimonas cestriensis]MCE2596717.1 IS66 family transposase [Motilimonas cestriensis]